MAPSPAKAEGKEANAEHRIRIPDAHASNNVGVVGDLFEEDG